MPYPHLLQRMLHRYIGLDRQILTVYLREVNSIVVSAAAFHVAW